jgi:hypothetical protein
VTEPGGPLIGAHELAAAKLIVQYGTAVAERLEGLGADATDIGAARALIGWGPLSVSRVARAMERVPEQVYGRPTVDAETALAELGLACGWPATHEGIVQSGPFAGTRTVIRGGTE